MWIYSRAIGGHGVSSNRRAPRTTAGKAAVCLISLLLLSGQVSGVRGQSPTPGCADNWVPTSTTGAPSGRRDHRAVWTGSEMIVWGGFHTNYTNDGGRYNPNTDTWTPTSTINAPTERKKFTAVWTGSEMIIWGGYYAFNGSNPLNDGGRYNPATDSWTPIGTTNAPSARGQHTAVWTGNEMIVWGGLDGLGNYVNTGGKYNPVTDSWTAINPMNAPTPRYLHAAVWTGSEMIIWGGWDGGGGGGEAFANTGGRYNPNTDSWTATGTFNAPVGREYYTAIWTGSEMIIWGGYNVSGLWNDGWKYNPATDMWTFIDSWPYEPPTRREDHTAVWTGSEMIIWGGFAGGGTSGFVNTGARYNRSTNLWTATATTNAPTGRQAHTAIWTGSEMIIWGGGDGGITGNVNTGGRYCAQPVPTPAATITISGNVSCCSNPSLDPVAAVSVTLTGSASGSVLSNGSGSYAFSFLPGGGSYTVTPSKAAVVPGTGNITTVDLVAIQRHFLGIQPLSGCRLNAADVNGDTTINNVDITAVLRFLLGYSTGIGNTGKYQFIPASRSYPVVSSDQSNQNYDTLIFGDVAAPFVE